MFAPEIYAKRREVLAKGELRGVALFVGNSEAPMNYRDNCYPFRQDSTFLYYFGHSLPDLCGTIDLDTGESALWGHDATLDEIIWTGPVPTLKERQEAILGDFSGSLSELKTYIEKQQNAGREIHWVDSYREENNLRTKQILNCKGLAKKDSALIKKEIIKQRAIKSSEEILEIESANKISFKMYSEILCLCNENVAEQEIVGAITGVLARNGSLPSFRPILSVHGETLHNHGHANILKKGDMLLIDSGAESPEHYASDITRTYPVNRRFDERQKALYSILYDAQTFACESCAPGVSYWDLHLQTCTRMAEGLKELGLMKGDVQEAVQKGAFALFMPHGLGHMLGLDVHDMENYGEDLVGYGDEKTRSTIFGLSALRMARELQPGHVVTVEPGLYFIPELISRWHNKRKFEQYINYDQLGAFKDFGGMRVEDDVLVTKNSSMILGEVIPKSIHDIESFK